ncbi:unnamed protein product [Rhodiola kirilowii]
MFLVLHGKRYKSLPANKNTVVKMTVQVPKQLLGVLQVPPSRLRQHEEHKQPSHHRDPSKQEERSANSQRFGHGKKCHGDCSADNSVDRHAQRCSLGTQPEWKYLRAVYPQDRTQPDREGGNKG